VQNLGTNEVLNSGTKFDLLTTPISTINNPLPLKVYPTLAQNYLNVELPFIGDSNWEIIDTHGQTIQKGQFNECKSANLSIHPLIQGLYWIKVESGSKKSFIAKFIKT
jgi:hypothetical protein